MVFKKLSYVLADEVDFRDIFVAQANIHFDPSIVHLARIFNWVGSKDGIRNVKRSAVEGTRAPLALQKKVSRVVRGRPPQEARRAPENPRGRLCKDTV